MASLRFSAPIENSGNRTLRLKLGGSPISLSAERHVGK
jgi:hypothetical protein